MISISGPYRLNWILFLYEFMKMYKHYGKGILVLNFFHIVCAWEAPWKGILYIVNINDSFSNLSASTLQLWSLVMSRRRNCLSGTFLVLLSFLEGKENPLQVSLFQVNCLRLIYPCFSLHYIRYIWHTGPGIHMKYNKKVQKLLFSMRFYFPWAFFSTKINEK